jgi:hypothetical protein
MSTEAILSKARMIQTEINVYKQEIAQLNYKVKDQQDKIKDNKEKIKLNKQLPYLVANVVEVRVSPPRLHSKSGGALLNPLKCALLVPLDALAARADPGRRGRGGGRWRRDGR